MMDHLIEVCFATGGLHSRSTGPDPGCPTDETFAGYAAALLPGPERGALEGHALRCADCHELLRSVIDGLAGRAPVAVRAAPVPATRLVARLLERGVTLVGELETSLLGLAAPPVPAALGGLRRAGAAAGAAPGAELLRISGPGQGLEALELQTQADGTLQLVVSGRLPDERREGELLSLVLEHDGEAREQRPFDGRPVRFTPIGAGRWRVRLVGRVPGAAARELARAEIELLR